MVIAIKTFCYFDLFWLITQNSLKNLTSGLKVIATCEPLDIDTQDPSVFLLRAFKYLIANQELLTIRKRAKVSVHHA